MSTRTIANIKPTVSRNGNATIYIDFSDGKFGTHSKYQGDTKWTDGGLTAEELAEAKRLALKNGKWTTWKAPRPEYINSARSIDPEPRNSREETEAERLEVIKKNITTADPELYG